MTSTFLTFDRTERVGDAILRFIRVPSFTFLDAAFARFESARLLSLGHLARTCLLRKA